MTALEEWVRFAAPSTHGDVLYALAAAAIAELQAEARSWAESFKMAEQSIVELQDEVERLKRDLDFVSQIHDGCTEQLKRDHERAEAADAEVERLKWMLGEMKNPLLVADLARRWEEHIRNT